MTKEEFLKMMEEEKANGLKAASAEVSGEKLIKICVAMDMAAKIIGRSFGIAKKEKDMEFLALCLLASEGIDMVKDKLLTPMLNMAGTAKKEQAEE